jgi:hypothetical protein
MAYLAKSMGSTYQEEEGPDVGQVEEEGSAVGGPESALGIFPHRAHTKVEAFYMVSFGGESEKED